jgi:multidrug efflux pump subunit AcrB
MITISIILLGLGALSTIKRDNFPNVDLEEMTITVRYPGASPEDVELNVTNKIEEELKEVDGIDTMTSFSMENFSFIHIKIDPSISNKDTVKRDIRDAVSNTTELPTEITENPRVNEITTAKIPVIEVGLSGEIPYAELRELAKRFKKKLLELPGVSRVEEYGYLDREIKVELKPKTLETLQIPARDVASAIRARNIRSTAGSFESYTSEKNIVTLAQFLDPIEVGDVIVRSTFSGPKVRVSELAKVIDSFEPEKVLSRINGRSAISFIVFKKESADIIRTVDAVKALAENTSKMIRAEVGLLTSNDKSKIVRNRLKVVLSNGLIGLLLLIITLSISLNIRTAFWVAIGIPVALMGVVFFMPIFDVYLDSIAVAAMIIVIGIIVDDAIIIAENISRHMSMGKLPIDAAVDGTREVFLPVLTTIVTTLLAFAPMFFMTGIMGKFVYVIPLVVTISLIVSFAESIFALPAHISGTFAHISAKGGSLKERTWFSAIRRPYEKLLQSILRLRYIVLVIFIATLAATLIYTFKFMDFVLFPTSTAEEFYIAAELTTGASLEATSDKLREFEELVETIPKGEISSYTTRIGTQQPYIVGESENRGIISVFLTPFSTRERTADEIVEGLRVRANKISGVDNLLFHVEGGGPPVGRPVTLRVIGSDDKLRTKLSDEIVEFLSTIDGVKDIDRDDKSGKAQLEISIDYDKLSKLGLTVANVAQSVRLAYDGEVVTTVRYGDEDVGFRVIFTKETRRTMDVLNSLLIPNDRDRLIRLSEVAKLKTGPGPSNFYHYDGERTITITSDVLRDITTPLKVTSQVTGAFDMGSDWPGLRLLVGGEAEETAESMKSLYIAFIAAIIGIYFVLTLLFGSFLQPIIALSILPFGFIGVIGTFAMHGKPLGFIAFIGVIGLMGVLVNDSLVLVQFVNQLKKRGNTNSEDFRETIIEGSSIRLRPILITSVTTVAGLLPMAYGIGGADPFMAPMALAMGYGIFLATPLTLILLPAFLLIQNDLEKLVQRTLSVFIKN